MRRVESLRALPHPHLAPFVCRLVVMIYVALDQLLQLAHHPTLPRGRLVVSCLSSKPLLPLRLLWSETTEIINSRFQRAIILQRYSLQSRNRPTIIVIDTKGTSMRTLESIVEGTRVGVGRTDTTVPPHVRILIAATAYLRAHLKHLP